MHGRERLCRRITLEAWGCHSEERIVCCHCERSDAIERRERGLRQPGVTRYTLSLTRLAMTADGRSCARVTSCMGERSSRERVRERDHLKVAQRPFK